MTQNTDILQADGEKPKPAALHAADRDLLLCAKAGDAGAQEEVADRMGCLSSFVERLLRRGFRRPSSDLVDELAQEAFTRLWDRAERFEGLSSLEGWAWGFAVLVVRGDTQARLREDSRRLAEIPETDEASDNAPQTKTTELIVAALEEMPPVDREIIQLHIVQTLSYEEIEARIGLSKRAIRSRYSRAMERLRGRFGDSVLGSEREAKP